ncbi:MAG: hypothetical protein ACXIVG_14730 [Pararhodobacter sp.]
MITQLKQAERVLVDSDRVSELMRRLGPAHAEAYVAERVEEISNRLAKVEASHRKAAYGDVVPDAERVEHLSGEIGLISLAKVSHDLRIAASHDDSTACHAVWERLVRIGDRSLAQVWELPALSM